MDNLYSDCENVFPVPCGVRHLIPSAKAKIVGGKDADPGAYPWQAQISHKVYGHICGGTILTSKFIVSAAHCFPLKRGSNYTITLGKNYAMTPTPVWSTGLIQQIGPLFRVMLI